jgi:hypothetical protein
MGSEGKLNKILQITFRFAKLGQVCDFPCNQEKSLQTASRPSLALSITMLALHCLGNSQSSLHSINID